MYVRSRATGEIQTGDQFERYARQQGVNIVPGAITPELLDQLGFDPVFESPQPEHPGWQHAVIDGAEEIEGDLYIVWRLEPAEFTPEIMEQQRSLWLASLANTRWEKATGTFDFNGVLLDLKTETTNNLDSAYMFATRDSNFTARWSIDDRTFVTLDAATIIAMGDAVGAFVQACFARQSDLADQILAAEDYEDLLAIDLASGWPGQVNNP